MCVDNRLSVSQIRVLITNAKLDDYPALMNSFSEDPRKAVQAEVSKMGRQLEKLKIEQERLSKMFHVEQELREKGFQKVCGIDEVGRGPLAGPVVAAAVIMPADSQILYINDSKKLNAKKRESLAKQIREEAIAYAIGIQAPEVIDDINILEATKLAMNDAVERLSVTPDILLIDALQLPSPYPVKAVVHGDALCYSIATASILAKVYRDAIMQRYHELYPEYGFDSNMGYGTAGHIAALKKYGPTPIHRKSFIKSFV